MLIRPYGRGLFVSIDRNRGTKHTTSLLVTIPETADTEPPMTLGAPPRIRVVRRYLSWQGRQRPMLGIALPSFDPLARVADRARVHATWQRCFALASQLQLDCVALPPGIEKDADDARSLLRLANEQRLACFLQAPANPDQISEWASDDQGESRVESLAELHRGLAVAARLSGRTTDDALEDTIEEDLWPRLAERGVPLLVAVRDTLGPT